MRRAWAAALAALAALASVAALAPRPAAAIETASFGLTPARSATARTSLHERVRPGATATDAVRVFNKTAQPLTLALSVSGASLGDDGQVRLGGTGGAARWVHLGTSTVTLPPNGSTTVALSIRAPRTMPAGESTAAVVAEPAPGSAQADVAVLQRVALMVYVRAPEGSSLRAALGWVAWVAAVLLAGVLVYALSGRGPRRRRQEPTAPGEPLQ